MTIATTTTRTDAEIQAGVISELKWEPRVPRAVLPNASKDQLKALPKFEYA